LRGAAGDVANQKFNTNHHRQKLQQHLKQIYMIFFTIIFLIFVSGAEIDICVPSFPQISDQFHLSAFATELLLGVNLFFHCLTSLIAGNIGDKYGKKRTINAGLIIFVIGSLLCFIATSYNLLLIARAIQGIGVAMPMVLGPLLIMDHYPKDQHQKMMAMLNGFCTLGICTAPTIGSYITIYLGWRFVFLLLAMLGILSLIIFSLVIKSDNKNNKNVKISLAEYLPIFKSKTVLIYLTALCSAIGGYYTFVAIAPLIYVKSFGVPLSSFGIYQGTLTLTFGIFSIFSGRIISFIGKKIAFSSSIFLVIASNIFFVFFIIFNVKSAFFITASILLMSIGWVYPINLLYVMTLAILEDSSGRLSAMVNILKWLFSILGFQLASYFYSNDFRSTGLTMIAFDLTSIGLIFYLYFKNKKFRDEIMTI
jgi:DHA1 family bicyclomycin/chloramphenicol resistance-like MFS transporter